LAFETVKKLVSFLQHVQIPILGVIENMWLDPCMSLEKRILDMNLIYSGKVSYDPALETSLSNVDQLLVTSFSRQLKKIVAMSFPTK
jgi:Mrp family chromosome partitioning ATPase